MNWDITENILEITALDWFQSHGYKVAFGPDISPEFKLSKLISGKLRIPDAENFVEEAGCQ